MGKYNGKFDFCTKLERKKILSEELNMKKYDLIKEKKKELFKVRQ